MPKHKKLKKTGRLQYFYSSPSSLLPIRDVLNEHGMGFKTEPHIECGAENLWSPCYQSNNIIPHINSSEKYLFLVTTPHHEEFPDIKGKKVVVGYIQRTGFGTHEIEGSELQYVYGVTKLFDYEHAIPITDLKYNNNTRMQVIDKKTTKKILKKFKGLPNILKQSIDEIIRLDERNITCPQTYGYTCPFVDNCRRYEQIQDKRNLHIE